MHEVRVSAQPLERFAMVIGGARVALVHETAARLEARMGGRSVWNLNSTERGGGVAELLRSIVGYARATRVDVRWGVIDASPDFFRITKRLHNALHGSVGDGSPLGEEQHRIYEDALAAEVPSICEVMRAGDVCILHDPQTAGLLAPLAERGIRVVWRCHVGGDEPDNEVSHGWEFLRRYLGPARRYVFSRISYAPSWLDPKRIMLIPPTIDPFSTKNQVLEAPCAEAILQHTGILGGPPVAADPLYLRDDGTRGRVEHRSEVYRFGPAPGPEVPLVVQVSRWDRLKDPAGVMAGFARLRPDLGASLVLAGPEVGSVADDPESGAVFAELVDAASRLPEPARARVQLASLPMADAEENGVIVNALQSHARVVVQKSLHEGFGLTVAEAMWKGRPVIGSAVGGIQDQIEDGVSGLLLRDPADLDAFAALLERVLADPELAERLGREARERVKNNYLGLTSLLRYAEVVNQILE